MLSPHELEVMNLLWAENRPLTRAEIVKLSTDKSWKPSTIHLLLTALQKKGAVKVDGSVRSGKVFARTYAAAITPEQNAVDAMKQQSSGRFSLSGVFAALVDREVDDGTLDELQQILDERKKRRGEE